jgi:hypothetical protein
LGARLFFCPFNWFRTTSITCVLEIFYSIVIGIKFHIQLMRGN